MNKKQILLWRLVGAYSVITKEPLTNYEREILIEINDDLEEEK